MGSKVGTADVAYDGMDVELNFQITTGNCYFQEGLDACHGIFWLKIFHFVPLIVGSQNHEMDHFTSAGKASGLTFLWGLKLASHKLHMIAWMLNWIFESPLVTVIFKVTLMLFLASFWGTPKNTYCERFRVRSKKHCTER